MANTSDIGITEKLVLNAAPDISNLRPLDEKHRDINTSYLALCKQAGFGDTKLFQCKRSVDGHDAPGILYIQGSGIWIAEKTFEVLNKEEIEACLAYKIAFEKIQHDTKVGDRISSAIPFGGAIILSALLWSGRGKKTPEKTSRRRFLTAGLFLGAFGAKKAMDVLSPPESKDEKEARTEIKSVTFNPHQEHVLSAARKLETWCIENNVDPQKVFALPADSERRIMDAIKAQAHTRVR